jgi:hypothetical protein
MLQIYHKLQATNDALVTAKSKCAQRDGLEKIARPQLKPATPLFP